MKYYFDKCLSFGCAISCKLFEMFSTFLEWLVKDQSGFETVNHYLNDFIFKGSANTDHCKTLMQTFEDLCVEIGVPLKTDKTVAPTSSLVYLGLEIDTVKMQVLFPQDNLKSINFYNTGWSEKKMKLSELQTLVGKLIFLAKQYQTVEHLTGVFTIP